VVNEHDRNLSQHARADSSLDILAVAGRIGGEVRQVRLSNDLDDTTRYRNGELTCEEEVWGGAASGGSHVQ
jgi:hypothetical protein